MKIRETQERPVGLGSREQFVRVRELAEGEELPAGAEVLDAKDKREPHDWERVEG